MRVKIGLKPVSAKVMNQEIYLLLFMINAPITPGTQAHKVRRKTISTDPQPLSTTASGGKMMQSSTRRKPMVICDLRISIY